ncbi:MAG: hypothetical protein JWP89_5176 [Schlesneria sp.]|nr:hypothetical protein [Schlesneria sp.]
MFDPYRKWLGIPLKDQPPNHYRLLGVELYESDLDVIEGAAERQMSFVRQYQSGEYAADAAKILNELAMARLCLLKPATKSAYDGKLREQLAPVQEEPDFDDLPMAELPKRSRSKKKKGSGLPPNTKIIGGIGIAVCLLAVFLMSPRRSRPSIEPPNPVVNTPPPAPNSHAQPASISAIDQPKTDALLWPISKLSVETAGDPIDLMKAVNLPRDVVKGEWQQTSDALIGPPDSRIYLPTKAPEHYQLKMSVRRMEGNEGLNIGFMMAGHQGIVTLDGWNSTVSGLFVDGRDSNDNCTTKKCKLFQEQSAGEIVLTVHPGHLHVRFDKETVIDWYGDPERLYLHGGYEMGCRESVFVATMSKVVIESAKIIPIKPEASVPRLPRLDREVDILPLTDPDRDAVKGIWALNKNSISSPEGVGVLYLPTVVPEEYTLSATVERPEQAPDDHATIVVGLPVSKGICQLTIVNSDCLGIDMIDGQRWNYNEARRSGSYLKKGVPAQLDCTVTKKGVRCDIDGRTLVEWHGESNRLSRPGDWALSDARRLSLSTHHHLRFRDIKIGPPKSPPPFPVHPSFSVGKEVDLLSLVNPERDKLNGKWERDGTAIRISEANGLSRLVIPSDVPAEYKLTMRVAREGDGERELNVSLPFSNSQADVVFDGAGTSGMHVDFRNTPENITTYREPVMVDDTPVDLTFFVRRTGLKVMNGEKTIIDWVGNPLRATWHWGRTVPQGRLAIGCWNQKFRFEKLVLEQLPPSGFPEIPSLGKDGKLLPILDAKRDSRLGEWKLDSAGLVSSTERITRLRIPVVPPEKYVLSATVERLEGPDDLYFGLIVGGHCCAVPLDGEMSKAGVDQLDGKRFLDAMNFTQRKYSTPLFPLGKTSQVRCYVLPDTIVVRCGDLDVVRWHGDPRRLSQDPNYYPPHYSAADRANLWLGTFQTSFRIRDFELKPLSDAEEKEIKQYGSDVYPTKPQLDVPLAASSLKASATTTTSAIPSGSWLLNRKADAKALLLMNDGGDQEAAIAACRQVRLPFDLYPEFPKPDYSRYSLVVVGTNMMDHWGQPANKHPDAFKPLADFVQSGGHLVVFNAYNGRNMEHLIPLGITTGFNHSWTFEKVPGASDILFNGAEDLIPAGNYLQQAGNFTVQKPHVVMLRRGSGSFAGEPTFATLPHGSGRLTYSSVEPGYGDPPGYWLFQAAIRWAARGAPVTAKDLEQLNAEEAESQKPSEPPGKKLEILEAKYGVPEDLTVITPAVTAGAKSGRLMMAVDSSLIGRDPKNGVAKFMHLRYRLNGIEEFRKVPEYQPVVIEARNASNSVTDNKFKLIEVRWGVGIYSPNNGIDLTRKFKPLVSRNGLRLTQEAQNQAVSGVPDPKYGVTKSFYVQYQYQGQERGAVFAGGALINLGDPPEKK